MNNYRYDINVASVDSPRTLFKIPHNYKSTFNAGDLIPVFIDEVLPGDSWNINVSAIVRELTLLNPVLDNSYIEFDAFFVPYRIVWNNLKQFFGEVDQGVWTPRELLIPNNFLDLNNGDNTNGFCTIGDYLGLPITFAGDNYTRFNYLPLRAYTEIWNYYYLAESTQSMVLYSKDDNVEFGAPLFNGYNSFPLKVNRFPDLFTTALPQPQKGPSVPFLNEYIPVIARTPRATDDSIPADFQQVPVSWINTTNNSRVGPGTLGVNSSGFTDHISGTRSSSTTVAPDNLFAATGDSVLNNINALRIAIATQQYYETLARMGSRYSEFIYGMFGVKTPSEVINVPQYLGSIKKLINVNQVLSTADSDSAILGTTGAYSHTSIANEKLCFSSFTEFGYIMVLAHVRTDNTYSQGVPKLFTKKSKFDFYTPQFANIGNVGIKNREIYFTDSSKDDEIFGYAEAWYEYKSKPNILTGYMRPGVDNSFSSWTYGRVFESTPVLNSDFTTQTAEEVNRTIAVSSEISNQFKLDLFFSCEVSRTMPLYIKPGLDRI